MDAATQPVPRTERESRRPGIRTGCFVLEAMTGLGTSYYGYYIFFFMKNRFGFSNADNLLLTVFYGFTYMVTPPARADWRCAWGASAS